MTYQPENLERWTSDDPACGGAGNYAGADLSAFYVAPISIARDTSDARTLSNWRVISAELEKVAAHEESGENEFGHWAVGWYRLWLIHESDEAALRCADSWAASLADYPIADESDLSELEHEAECESWESWGRSDWRAIVEKALQHYAPDGADQYWADEVLDSLPDQDDALDWLWRDGVGGESWSESEGPTFNFRDAGPRLSASLLSEAVGLALLPPDQQWRFEPYPWAGADPAPLAAPLPLEPGRG
jgi:hypothetical protein